MKLRDTAAFRTEFAEDNEKDEKTSHSLLIFLVLLVPCVGTRISLYCISPSFSAVVLFLPQVSCDRSRLR